MKKVLMLMISFISFIGAQAPQAAQSYFGILCQTRGAKVKYAAEATDCSKEKQEAACMTKAGIADALKCTEFKTDAEIDKFFEENLMTYGLECYMEDSGIGYRVSLPDCSDAAKKDVCAAPWGRVIECKDFGKDHAGLSKWSRTHINKANITCQLKDVPGRYTVPGRDCSPTVKKAVCVGADPVSCDIKVY